MFKFLILAATFLVALFTVVHSSSVVIDDGNYVLETTSGNGVVNFTITSASLGWIGMGISPSGAMAFSDIVIAGVLESGEVYLRDSFATGTFPPTLDPSQDVQLISAEENATHTTVRFSRLLVTGDNWDDLPVEDKEQNIIWAVGETDEIKYHIKRGSIMLNLLQ